MMNYVNKKDLQPYKDLFNEAMMFVHDKIDEYKYYYRLVGSAKRNLVIEHHNKGFDLDYQIIFYESIQPKSSKELIEIKNRFRNIFNDFLVNKGYNYADDSTSAITIKYPDDSKIINSYDVVLLSPENDGFYVFKYQNEEKTIMNLVKVKNSLSFQNNYKKIKGSNMWSLLREKYKYKKNNNEKQKKSFSLLIESVNEILDLS